jgi:hypothetical protein
MAQKAPDYQVDTHLSQSVKSFLQLSTAADRDWKHFL